MGEEYNALEVIETAMEIEKGCIKFFRQAVERVGDATVSETFKNLADDDADHLDILEAQYESLASSETWVVFQELYSGGRESGSREARVLDDELHELIVDGMTPKHAVEAAIRLEKDAAKYYANHSKMCGDPSGCEMFQKLEAFEKEHLKELESLLEKLDR